MSDSDTAVVVAFNEFVNSRDLDELGRLMHERHRFVDSAGSTVSGKAACLAAWRGFFDAFPDYRNVFDTVESYGSGAVEVHGRSECSTPELAGPARWNVIVEDGVVLEWRVSEQDG